MALVDVAKQDDDTRARCGVLCRKPAAEGFAEQKESDAGSRRQWNVVFV
jgi:hypothetical protein